MSYRTNEQRIQTSVGSQRKALLPVNIAPAFTKDNGEEFSALDISKEEIELELQKEEIDLIKMSESRTLEKRES